MARGYSFASGCVAATLALAVGGCGAPEVTQGVNDPFEARNRQVHEANIALDRAVIREAAEDYAKLPEPVRIAFSNLGQFLSLPNTIVNDVLQLRLGDAMHNTMRLAVNATFGLGGLLDPASEMGLDDRPTDFGVTLGVWGVPEGNYVVHPVIGPSTERDTFGMVIDRLLDPVAWSGVENYLLIAAGAKVAQGLGARSAFADTVDAILYESADSYAQARLIYLENRRFEVRGRASADTGSDPYADLYEVPYAQ